MSKRTVAQGVDHVWLDGLVINQADSSRLPLTQIASYKLVQIFAADSLGEFFIQVPKGDSLKFMALGFEAKSVLVDDLIDSIAGKTTIALRRTSYMIGQVDINYYKKFSEYQDYLKKMRAKQAELDLFLPPEIKLGKGSDVPPDLRPLYRSKPPVLAAFFQPINYIYYHTSKLEKSKIKVLKLMEETIIRELLTVEMMREVSSLEGKELESFIVYCNVNVELNKYDTTETVRVKVMDLFAQYINE
ncbi:hypothetical protein [Carboxylicivirga sp. N1Y90]|uniref:hypothetical protein n=1 Tax=Carboxylicivirga fragile TaxID=3417571 RepID=UPI003D32F7A3|nr:hypothetical protein [Marinilabiliaceae bacterium N1Y90]